MRREWAYGAVYGTAAERTRALAGWLDWYNTGSNTAPSANRPSAARLNELLGNNLLGNYS